MNYSDLGLPISVSAGSNAAENRFVNPYMLFDQVNEGAAITPAATQYLVDQWACSITQSGNLTFQGLSTQAPAGFSNSLQISVASAYTSAATDEFTLYQRIEGCNVTDLAFGTASAQNIILSFWIYTSLTGTYAGAIQNSAANRSYLFTFSVSTANTWQLVTLSIPGDTTGTWLNGTKQVGLEFILDLGSGSNFNGTAGAWAAANTFRTSGAVSFVANASAAMYVTGFCLRAGTAYIIPSQQSFQQQLIACQRYCEKSYDLGTALGSATAVGEVNFVTTTSAGFVVSTPFKVSKMTEPTMTIYSPNTGASGKMFDATAVVDIAGAVGNIGQNMFTAETTSAAAGRNIQWHWLATTQL